MAKGADKEVKNEINREQGAVNSRYQDLYTGLDTKRADYTARSDAEREGITNALKPLAETTGGLDPTVVNNIRGLYGWRTGSPETNAASGGSSGGDSGGGSVGGTAAPAPDKWQEPNDIYSMLGKTGGIDFEAMRGLRGGLDEIGRTGGWTPNAMSGVEGDIANLRKLGTDGGFSPELRGRVTGDAAKLREYGLTGGWDPEAVAGVRGDINEMRRLAPTGGYDAGALATSRGRIGALDELGRTGGMSPEDIARFRGTGYDEFARTGGYTDEQIREMRNRATSPLAASYQSTMDEANRLRNAGGSNTGFLAAASRARRQNAQDFATAGRDAELGIRESQREGRKWGIEGAQETENELQQILTRGKLGGASAAAQYGNELEGNVAAGTRGLLGDAAKAESDMASDIAKNRISGTAAAGELETNFQTAISRAMTDASRGAGDLQTNMQKAITESKTTAQNIILQNETKAQELRQQGQIAGAQGLTTIAAQKAAEAARAQGAANAARASDQANDRYWASFISGNERWIGEQQQEGQQNAIRGMTTLYGMDPTLARDALQVNTASSWADDNRGLLGLDVQANQQKQGGGILDWLKFGSGFIPSGKPDVNSRGGGGDVSGIEGDSSWNYGGDMGFGWDQWEPPQTQPAPTPNVDYEEEFQLPPQGK